MNRLQKRPADKRQRSHTQRQSRQSSCMAAVLISSIASLSTYCPPSASALRPPPTSFVSSPHFTRRHYLNNRGDGGTAARSRDVFHQQQPHNSISISIRCTQKQKRSRIMLSANNDDDDNDHNNNGNNENEYNNKDNEDNEEDEEEEQDNELKSNLNKISWLPSVKLGKQPIHPNTFGQVVSRKESQDGKGYATTTTTNSSSSSSSSSSPPGYKNIEILPVLPMTMVHGIEMLSYDDDNDNGNGNGNGDNKDNDDDDTTNHNNNHRHLSVDDLMSMDPENLEHYLSSINSYGMGVWEGTSNLHDSILLGGGDGSSSMGSVSGSVSAGTSSTQPGSMFSGTSSYLPHTKGHVFTIAESRYKKLYDDLVRMGSYYGKKRESAIRREKQKEIENDNDDYGSGSSSATTGGEGGEEDIMMPSPYIVPSSSSSSSSILPDPEEKRRFIVTTSHPMEDGVFAEYGLLFQLKDLDEVAAVASYETGGGEFGDDDEQQGMMTMEEIQELVDSVDIVTNEYGDAEVLEEEDKEDVMDILLRTHYEATHDVVGRVKIHRFVNPECYNDGPEGDEYLMAEATILDVVKDDRRKMCKSRSSSSATASEEEQTLATARSIEQAAKEKAEGEVAKAVARIKDELRSSVSEAFKQQQQLDPQKIKDKLRSALDEAPTLGSSSGMTASNGDSSSKGTIPLGPKGVYVEKRSDDSLSKEERALRESFAKLVALQHELKEECRFTRMSVQTFGIGPVGVWLSAAAWSQFVQKRLESSHGDMQSDLQSKLVEYLESSNGLGGYRSQYGSDGEDGGGSMGGETIDFDELSPELQQEFHLVQNRATEELGPLAMDRAIQMQRIVQAETYTERLDLLRECVDNERRRLEAKKMLQSLAMSSEVDGSGRIDSRSISREEARSLFERLMSSDNGGHKRDVSMDPEGDAFQ